MKGDRKFAPLFSVWQIDAWADENGGWTWNDKVKLFEFRTDALNEKRAFLSRLKAYFRAHNGSLGRGWYYVDDDDYSMTVCRRCDGEPWFACIRETPR